MKKIVKFFLVLCICVSLGILIKNRVGAQTATDSASTNNAAAQDLLNQINDLQSKISDLQGQEKTLSSQIGVFDSQIQLTGLRISQTKEQLTELTTDIETASKKIDTLNSSLQNLTKVLLNRIVVTYEIGSVQPLSVLLSSNTASDFFSRANYLRIAQAHDKQLIYETQQAKTDYANQKNIFEDKKKQEEVLQTQLQAYNDQLSQQKAAKQNLLSQTQGSEATYQRLLAQARAQLSGFSNFVSANGGASILSNQTVCDDWGCYYNQRDGQWGNVLINGQGTDCGGPCSVAKVGCLITSVAMVASHMGHKDILPSNIAQSSGDNFSVNTAMLAYSINVNGVSIHRNRLGSSSGAIPGTISEPIIVGVTYDGGPIADHFVVLVSGSSGNYIMNDPFVPNGHNIPFTSHYSLGSVVEVYSVSM